MFPPTFVRLKNLSASSSGYIKDSITVVIKKQDPLLMGLTLFEGSASTWEFPINTHTYTHTHAPHTHTHMHTHSFIHSLSLSLKHTHTHTHTHTHAPHTHMHTHSLTLSLSLKYTHTHTHTHKHIQTYGVLQRLPVFSKTHLLIVLKSHQFIYQRFPNSR